MTKHEKVRVLSSGEKNVTVLHFPSGRIEYRLQLMKHGKTVDLRYDELAKAIERRNTFKRLGELPDTSLPKLPGRPKLTLAEAIVDYQRSMVDPMGQPLPTAARCTQVLTAWRACGLGAFLDTPVSEITTAMCLQARLARIEHGASKQGTKGLRPSTVTRDEHVIRAALRRYHGAGFKFPEQPQELATRCPLLKPETLGLVLDRAMDEPFSTIAWMAAKSAMRLTSICTVRQDQLDWQPDGGVRLTNVKTKTGLQHFTMSVEIGVRLRVQISERAKGSAYVFPSDFWGANQDRPVSAHAVSANWLRARKEIADMIRADDPNEAAQLDGFRFHDLRHYAITAWIKSGATLAQVQMAAKLKKSELVTQRYGHLAPADVTSMQDAVVIGAQSAGRRRLSLVGGRK